MTTSTLSACPFCDSELWLTVIDYQTHGKYGHVSCGGCSAHGPKVPTYFDLGIDAAWRDKAKAGWNKRTAS